LGRFNCSKANDACKQYLIANSPADRTNNTALLDTKRKQGYGIEFIFFALRHTVELAKDDNEKKQHQKRY